MWTLEIILYLKNAEQDLVETGRIEGLKFPTRFAAEEHISWLEQNKAFDDQIMLGFVRAPWGTVFTVDPTLKFWMNLSALA